MSEKPIIFSTPMVRAILEGRKTQTRRVIKPQPTEAGLEWVETPEGFAAWRDPLLLLDEYSEDGGPCLRLCPYGQPGDILYVRETWCTHNDLHANSFDEEPLPGYYYKADAPKYWANEVAKWHPSIHMPRQAARIFLKVTDIRVERLQDITENDAAAEGFSPEDIIAVNLILGTPVVTGKYIGPANTAKNSFRVWWDSLYSKQGYSWHTNPFCWVIQFEVCTILSFRNPTPKSACSKPTKTSSKYTSTSAETGGRGNSLMQKRHFGGVG